MRIAFKRTVRSLPLVVPVAALLLAGVGMLSTATPATAKTPKPPKYAGAAPGSVTCSLSAKVSFLPPLTKSSGGTSSSAVKGTLTGCTSSNSTVTITRGKVIGSFASSPLSCATMSTNGASASLHIAWKGSVNGVVGGTIYAGKATFAATTIGGGSATGSFSGGVTTTVTPPSDLATLCGATKGIKKVDLTGIVHLDGNPTVKPTLTITASDGTQTYGGSPPTITPSYSGFVNGDGPGDLTPPPTCVPNTASSSPAGFYASQSTCYGAVDPNYTIVYANGDVTVKQATLTITANPVSKLFGSPDPVLTFASSGLIGTDTTTGHLTRNPGEAPGNYQITLGTLAVGPNYTIVFVSNFFTIEP